MCLGQTRQGVELAPEFLREFDLIKDLEKVGWQVEDQGDIGFQSKNRSSNDVFEKISQYSEGLSALVTSLAEEGNACLNVGGDHGIGFATISGLLRVYPKMGVVWVDAHGDMNTPETSPSGNFHGMPLAALMREPSKKFDKVFPWDRPQLLPENVILLGVRSLDVGEKEILERRKVHLITMESILEEGMEAIAKRCVEYFQRRGVEDVHISFDIDALDPKVAPATGTPCDNGLALQDAVHLNSVLQKKFHIVGMDLVEVNPSIVTDSNAVSSTLNAAKKLVLAAFGSAQVARQSSSGQKAAQKTAKGTSRSSVPQKKRAKTRVKIQSTAFA